MDDDKLNEFYNFLKYMCGISFLIFMTCIAIGVLLNLGVSCIYDSIMGATLISSVISGWGVLIVDCIIQYRGSENE